MNNELKLVRIDVEYCNYLRQFDYRVPYNYNVKQIRPFIGVLFEVNNCKYFAPLSSPKEKHLKLKNNLDLLKLDGGKLGVINFNNMLPVQNNNIIVLDLNKECLTESERKYQTLLKHQIYWLNRNNSMLLNRAKKLYDNYISGKLNKAFFQRCCNFKLLEEKCREYNNL